MTMKKKQDYQSDVFSGISSVFIAKGGIVTTGGTGTISEDNLQEFPVSDDGGFSWDTGSPSVNRFKIKGLNAAWTCTFTPGDGEIKLEIPCHETSILQTVYGTEGVDVNLTLPSTITVGGKNAVKGKGFASTQKAVYLGMLVLNETEDKLLYIKKCKFMAQTMFDASQKPLCVVLTGDMVAGADSDAFGILEPAAV